MFDSFIDLANPSRTFIIAEAGSNWKCGNYDDDVKRGKDLIEIAASSGADAVKFQTYRAEATYVSNAGSSNYLSEQGIDEDIDQIFKNLEMPYNMIAILAKYAEEQKIIFMSTPFSVKDAKEIDPYVSIHKIASFEINHIRLVEFLAKTKKPLIISTGASTYDEIDFAINLIKKYHNDIAILQCTSQYPCSLESLNLNVIPEMKLKYDIPVGLSDHSVEPLVGPLLAIGLGANIIEKHFTIDKNLPGPDHKFALTPDELFQMIDSIRKGDGAKGDKNKHVLNEEKELQQFAKRSLQATKKIIKGDILREGYNFDVLRPGNKLRGIEPMFLSSVDGKKSMKTIEIGQGILDFE
jgi:N,N'-diacetyllegionaminate synthase